MGNKMKIHLVLFISLATCTVIQATSQDGNLDSVVRLESLMEIMVNSTTSLHTTVKNQGDRLDNLESNSFDFQQEKIKKAFVTKKGSSKENLHGTSHIALQIEK